MNQAYIPWKSVMVRAATKSRSGQRSCNGALSELIIDDQCEHIYLTNHTNNTVEVFSLQTGALQAPIQVGSAPSGLDASPDDRDRPIREGHHHGSRLLNRT